MKRAIVVGSSGQDGRILSKMLRGTGGAVLGITRYGIETTEPLARTTVDIGNAEQVASTVLAWQPDEIYYLAAFHHSSQERAVTGPAALLRRSFDVHVAGAVHFLEALRIHAPNARFFYAASSLVFGSASGERQTEQTPLNPMCTYGITKAAGIQVCRLYRREHGIFASCGILYNHESEHRQPKFLSQKVIRGALAISRGEQQQLVLGDLDARIDWGYAADYVEAMQRVLALEKPDDFIIATGESHSVQEFVEIVFQKLGLDWRRHVIENPEVLTRRPAHRIGDASKLHAVAGWQPSVTFQKMIELLLDAACSNAAQRHAA